MGPRVEVYVVHAPHASGGVAEVEALVGLEATLQVLAPERRGVGALHVQSHLRCHQLKQQRDDAASGFVLLGPPHDL